MEELHWVFLKLFDGPVGVGVFGVEQNGDAAGAQGNGWCATLSRADAKLLAHVTALLGRDADVLGLAESRKLTSRDNRRALALLKSHPNGAELAFARQRRGNGHAVELRPRRSTGQGRYQGMPCLSSARPRR